MDPNKIGSNPEQQPGTGTETGLGTDTKTQPKKRKGFMRAVAALTGLFVAGGAMAGSAHDSDKAEAKTGPYPTNEHVAPFPAGPQSDNPESIIGTVDTSNNPGGGQGIEDASGNGKPNTGFVPSRAEDVPAIPNFNNSPTSEVAPQEIAPGGDIQTGNERPNTSNGAGEGDGRPYVPPVDRYVVPPIPPHDLTTLPGPSTATDPGNTTTER